MQSVKVGIIGGTGYTGMELLRLLAAHPFASAEVITSRSEAGRNVIDLFPSLHGSCDLKYVDPASAALENCDVVFSAAPNGVAMTHAAEILDAGAKMIDLSADFRLKDVGIWEQWYNMSHHCPDLVATAVYGLPEVNREQIRTATLVANPGCYPTCIQLGFLPLIQNGLVDLDSLIADAKSGVSGAGRSASLGTAFCELSDSFKAYSVSGHRHLPEIVQGLENASGKKIELVFTPHLLPLVRGIFATLYATLNESGKTLSEDELGGLFRDCYKDEPFVHVMAPGAHPDTRSVRGSNQCRLALHRPLSGKTVTVLAVEDNLVKGAAGQAIQNMNLMSGFPEAAGLEHIAIVP